MAGEILEENIPWLTKKENRENVEKNEKKLAEFRINAILEEIKGELVGKEQDQEQIIRNAKSAVLSGSFAWQDFEKNNSELIKYTKFEKEYWLQLVESQEKTGSPDNYSKNGGDLEKDEGDDLLEEDSIRKG